MIELSFKYPQKGYYFFLNTLFNSVVSLDEEHFNHYLSLEKEYNSTDVVVNFLMENNILTLPGEHEKKALEKFNRIFGNENKLLTCCVFTTMSCNLRCPYCYENHEAICLQEEKYMEILNFIENSNFDHVAISWFGGEPLISLEKINMFSRQICNLSLEKNFTFSASITTNGTLLTSKAFDKLIDANVSMFQITLDGIKENNDKTRVFVDGSGSFDIILSNLKMIKKKKSLCDIVIRCNVTHQTNTEALLDLFEKHFSADARFSILLFPVSPWTDDANNNDKSKSKIEINTCDISLVDLNKQVLRRGLKSALVDIFINDDIFCSYGIKNNFVLKNDGKLGNCTIKIKNNFGDITAENMKKYAELQNISDPLCEKTDCFLFPKCFGLKCRYSKLSDAQCEKQCKEFSDFLGVYYEKFIS